MIGQTLAHYKILEKIGSGGMGDVYLAEDTKLGRKVALKVLPPELAESEERRGRFKREAKALAALDHPNIVQVFSVEEADDIHFITMQLVQGKTLTELLPKNGFPLDKFFDIAIPLAEAVAAAHQEGITHRDLKPDNAMVGDDGRVRVLDFGLARPTAGFVVAGGASELPTQAKTQEGAIVGTLNYMSPEQATGKAVDPRSDIFSLGIIFYEMLTGHRPFDGATSGDVLSSIVKDTPRSVVEVRPEIPREFSKIVRRCLAKEPTRRYQSALDVRNELEDLRQEHDSGGFSEASAVKRGGVSYAIVASLLGAVAFFSAVATYVLIDMQPGSESNPGTLEGTFTQLTSQPGEEYFPSIAPDGDSFVYASYASGNWDIYLRRVEGERAINLTGDSLAEDTQPVFSPDGQQIAFRSERDGGGLFVMGATGESVRRVSTRGFNPAWSPDGEEIVFGTERILQPNNRTSVSQLWITNAATGDERLLTNGDAVQPHWSPGGERIAYWAIDEGAIRDLWTVSRDGDAPVQVTTDAFVNWNPVWSPDV